MKIENIAHILRASKAITQEVVFVLVGSQAILAQFPNAPDSLKMSMEIDIWPKFKPEMAEIIEGALGANSSFHGTFGYFADGVGPKTAILPPEWESRSISLKDHPLLDGAVAICPEVHDLCASKLVAFREKDLEWVQAAILSDLANPEKIHGRLLEIPDMSAPNKTSALNWIQSKMDNSPEPGVCMDTSDITRKAYLEAILNRMEDPSEDTRIRNTAQNLLGLKIRKGLIGQSHIDRWTWILSLPLAEMSSLFLADDEHGREMRHAHLFAGCLPAREANRIQKEALFLNGKSDRL